MNILFIHQNFPAQFKYLAPVLANQTGNRVVVFANKEIFEFEKIECYHYDFQHQYVTHPLLKEEYSKILRANAVLNLAKKLKRKGFYPHVIYLHPGWGEGLLIKDVWPESHVISYFEYFYQLHGQDVGFDPEFPISEQQQYLLRLKNNSNYQALDFCDQGVSPTYWQKDTYPSWASDKISVIHDGIDTRVCTPDSQQVIQLKNHGIELSKSQPVITFVARYLEPLRGFYQFMRAIPELLNRYPNIHVVIVGKDESGYGGAIKNGVSHKQSIIKELSRRLDLERVHFLGHLSYENYLKVLKVSTIHYYATYPFVVSWSLLEAMSCECALVASDVAPVREFILPGKNGLTHDFFNTTQLIENISILLEDSKLRKKLGKEARKTIKKKYKLDHCLAKQIKLINAKL